MIPIFELKNVSFRYPDSPALEDFNLTISQGESLAILGANGSGKSTLLRLLAGLCFPERGSIKFCSEILSESAFTNTQFAHDFRRRVGVVFQNPDVQLFNATVFDEISFGPLQMGFGRDEVMERVHAQLDFFGIAHLKNRAPHRLSGGEKKRVALASVLVLEPEVLLLDEPTAALDPQSHAQMMDFLYDCAGKKTIVTTAHSLDIVEEISTRVIVLKNGRLAATDAPENILQNQELLRETHLLHAHKHRHPKGAAHAHTHWH